MKTADANDKVHKQILERTALGTISILLKQSLCYSALATTSVGNINLYMSLN